MNSSPLALRLSAQSFPADSALCSTERAGKTAKKSIMRPKVLIFFLWALLSLLGGSNVHAFTMPTQKTQKQQAQPIQEQPQSAQIEKEEGEGVLKFLRSTPDPQKLPLGFDVRAGYVAKVAKMDYSSGEVTLSFYSEGTMEQVGEYKYIHHGVKAQTMPTEEEVQTAIASLPTQKDRASEYRKINRTERDVDFAQFLVAVLTFDDEVVDFERSIIENRVRLLGKYTPASTTRYYFFIFLCSQMLMKN